MFTLRSTRCMCKRKARKAYSCEECVRMRRSDDRVDGLSSSRVQGPPAGVILHCGRNNEKNRPGSFSWSQGPRPQVHCRNFPSIFAFFWCPLNWRSTRFIIRCFYICAAFELIPILQDVCNELRSLCFHVHIFMAV